MPQNPYICVSFNCPFVTAEVNSFYGAEPKFFLGGGSKHFVISSLFGGNDPIRPAYFSDGLVQPPTRFIV